MITLQKYLWFAGTQLRKLSFGHIGKMSYLGRPTSLYGQKNIFLGDKVRMQPGCRLEAHDKGEIHIEDETSIGQNFHCVAFDRLVIGKKTTISANVCILDCDHNYQEIGTHIMEQPMTVKQVEIGENCFIGFGAVLQAGTKLGRQCIVGSNAVVRGEYPDYCVIAGVPAKVIRQYNPESGEWERVKK